MLQISVNQIQEAQRVLAQYLEPTPLLHNPWLSDVYGCEVYLKMETMQPIGSFKIRGATYKIATLSEAEKIKGVIAASAGNHAQGVAWGSKKLGVDAMIVMPKTAPIVKVENTRKLGAKIVLFGNNYDEAYHEAIRLAQETGRTYVHAFEDDKVIAGQGAIGLEVLEQLPQTDFLISSIGGGGMIAGIATVFKAKSPETQIIGAQAQGSPSMSEAFKIKKTFKCNQVSTFADGIAVKEARPLMVELLLPLVDQILTAHDEQIADAVLDLLEKSKVVCEGAAAVSLAVLDQIKDQIKGKNVVIVLGGGNIDVNLLSRVIDHGLIKKGRLVRMNVILSDRPGSLARLTALIAEEGANIIQAIHDRSEPSTPLDKTEVALTIETRGPEHTQTIIHKLSLEVDRVFVHHT
jgi:threonine dehydratase